MTNDISEETISLEKNIRQSNPKTASTPNKNSAGTASIANHRVTTNAMFGKKAVHKTGRKAVFDK